MPSVFTSPHRRRRVSQLVSVLAVFACMAAPLQALAQTSPTPAAPSEASPATPVPQGAPAPAAPQGASSPTAQQPAPTTPDQQPAAETANVVPVTLTAHPVLLMSGQASWDTGYQAVQAAIVIMQSEAARAGLTIVGHPTVSFVQTDDTGFHYEAMLALASAPAGKDKLTDQIKIAQSPVGNALKFQHRGPYSEIDSTYEAITAFLDEKGIDADNVFIEEYLNGPKQVDDQTLEVDIYVLTKSDKP